MGPVYLIVMNFLFMLLGIATVVHQVRTYLRSRKPFARLLAVGSVGALGAGIMSTLGLGFEVIPVQITIKLMVLGFAVLTPIYIVVLLWRFKVFEELYSSYKIAKYMTIKNYAIGAGVLNVVTVWPLYVYVFDEPVEREFPWIFYYHFVGWALWETLIFTMDICVSVISLRFVVVLKRNMSTGSVLTPAQLRYYRFCVASLLCMIITDVINMYKTYELCSLLKHPDRDDMHLLAIFLLNHFMYAVWFLQAIALFIAAKSGPSINMSSINTGGSPVVSEHHVSTAASPQSPTSTQRITTINLKF